MHMKIDGFSRSSCRTGTAYSARWAGRSSYFTIFRAPALIRYQKEKKYIHDASCQAWISIWPIRIQFKRPNPLNESGNTLDTPVLDL